MFEPPFAGPRRSRAPPSLLPSSSLRRSQNVTVAPVAGSIANEPARPLFLRPVRKAFAPKESSSTNVPPGFSSAIGASEAADPATALRRSPSSGKRAASAGSARSASCAALSAG